MKALLNLSLPALSQEERYSAAVEKLKRLGVRVAPRTAWKESFGSMQDHEHFDEAVRLGAEWREDVNRSSS